MKNWEKKHITKNSPDLIQNIDCNIQLMCRLLSASCLTPLEKENIMARRTSQEQAYTLLETLSGKVDGYIKLVKTLEECQQTGAVKILLEGFAEKGIYNQTFSLHGRIYPIRDLFTNYGSLSSVVAILSKIQTTVEYLEYIKGDMSNHLLLRDCIPSVVPYYVSRKLKARCILKVEVFTELQLDSFLFKGQVPLGRVDLNPLANGNEILLSGEVSANKTARFILLENEDDLVLVKTLVKSPLHFIEVDSGPNYILRGTWDNTEKIRSYIRNEYLTYDERYFTESDSYANNITFICDIPGIGKSQLMAKIATSISETNSKSIVIYFSFPIQLMEFCEMFQNAKASSCYVDVFLLSYTTNVLSYNIIKQLVCVENWHVYLFLDGYEHVLNVFPKLGLWFLQELKASEKVKHIFVSARTNVRCKLENVLGVLGYQISPLSPEDQVELLSSFPDFHNKHKHCHSILDVDGVLESHNILSIPHHCVLLANFYTKHEYICCFGRIHRNSFVTAEEKKQFVFHVFKEFIFDSYKELDSYKCFNSEKWVQLKFQFCLSAIKSKFTNPEILHVSVFNILKSIPFSQQSPVREHQPVKATTGLDITTNEMYSEYIIADWIFIILTQINGHSYNTSVWLDFICFEILRFQQCRSFENPISFPLLKNHSFAMYDFLHKDICFFFDANIVHSKCFQLCQDALHSLSKIIVRCDVLYKILFCCALNGCSGILKLIAQVLDFARETDEFKSEFLRFQNHRSLKIIYQNLLKVACNFSHVETFKGICEIFKNFFGVVLNDLLANANKKYLSPIHIAIFRGNYRIVSQLSQVYRNSYVGMGFVHTCVAYTHNKDLFDKEDILKLLVKEFICSLHETIDNIASIVVPKIHPSLLKIMITYGANIFLRDIDGDPLSSSLINYMPPEEYHDIVEFVFENCTEAARLFTCLNSNEKTALQAVLANPNFNTTFKTVNLLMNKTNCYVNFVDIEGNNLLALAIKGRKGSEIIRELLKLDPFLTFNNRETKTTIVDLVHFARNEDAIVELLPKAAYFKDSTGNNLLHLSAKWHSPQQFHECVEILVDHKMIEVLRFPNASLHTPIQLALKYMEVLPETLDLICKEGIYVFHCRDFEDKVRELKRIRLLASRIKLF